MDFQTVSAEEVIQVHEALVRDFALTADPISPSGVRSQGLLESAASRQWTSLGGTLKYPNPVDNAATLLYGVCCNHPFVNGNKRTALVCMLVHLDKNKLTLFNTSQKQLYDLMIQVADHSIGLRHDSRARKKDNLVRRPADEEVQAVCVWLRDRAAPVVRGEKLVTYRELRKILENFGFYLEDPKGNKIDIIRYEQITKGLLRRRTVKERTHIGTIGWPGENRQMSFRDIKKVREICALREEDGVDSDAFYRFTVVIDSFVNRYRKVLRRLAKV